MIDTNIKAGDEFVSVSFSPNTDRAIKVGEPRVIDKVTTKCFFYKAYDNKRFPITDFGTIIPGVIKNKVQIMVKNNPEQIELAKSSIKIYAENWIKTNILKKEKEIEFLSDMLSCIEEGL